MVEHWDGWTLEILDAKVVLPATLGSRDASIIPALAR